MLSILNTVIFGVILNHFEVVNCIGDGSLLSDLSSNLFSSPTEEDSSSNSCSSTLDDNVSSIPVMDVRDELLEHTDDQFPKPEISKVTDGIYVAIGYDLANTIFVESTTGITIIDTLSEIDVAREAFDDYKSLRINTDKKRTESQMRIEGIILTHYHTDNSMGMGFWRGINAENGINLIPKIYAHKEIMAGFKKFFLYQLGPVKTRSMRQFGNIMNYMMDEEIVESRNLFINSGIGPFLEEVGEGTAVFIDLNEDENTVLFDDDTFDINIFSLSLKLIHSPGETPDQIAIWYNDKKVLFVGDNIYYAFPNLYTIRGTTPRDPKLWINTLDRFLEYDAEYMVGSHTKAICGIDNIKNEIELYRDLIAFVHDQTVRFMSERLRIDEIVIKIEESLPDILKDGRKQQFYGTIEWSIRSIYDMYLGYFQGDAAELYPSNFYDRGNGLLRVMKQLYGDDEDAMIDFLVNYLNGLVEEAQANRDDTKYIQVALSEERWILEMITSLLTYYDQRDEQDCDSWLKLSQLRWKILQNYAGKSVSANGRNYMISQYLEERFDINVEDEVFDVSSISIDWIMEALRFKIKPELILLDGNLALEYVTNLKFQDSGLMYQLKIRNGGVFTYDEYSKYDQSIINQYDENAGLIYQFDEINFKLKEVMNMDHVIKPEKTVEKYAKAAAFWLKFGMSV